MSEGNDGLESLQLPAGLSVSVIIPHFNDLFNLQHCVRLLSDQTLSKEFFEIVVADNNSSCGIAEVEKACSGFARIISVPVQGAAAARNAGVSASHNHFLAFIDSDCRPARNWLARGVSALARADMVGGQVNIVVDDERKMTPVECFESVFAFDTRRYVVKEGFSVTANMFVSRTTFDQIGGFRSEVSEDKEWGNRATALGFRWTYAADVVVFHPARKNWQDLRRKWGRITRETYTITKMQRFGRLRWALRAWAILISPLLHIARIFKTPRLKLLRNKLKAVQILFCIRIWRFVEAYRLLAIDLFSA